MITIAAPITVPNVTRLRVTRVLLFEDQATAAVTLEALSPGATPRVRSVELRVGNAGAGQRVLKNATPTTWGDEIVTEPFAVAAGAFDRIEAAYRGGASKAAAFRAVETAGLADGWIEATLGGVVS